jgi:hypothetical protein
MFRSTLGFKSKTVALQHKIWQPDVLAARLDNRYHPQLRFFITTFGVLDSDPEPQAQLDKSPEYRYALRKRRWSGSKTAKNENVESKFSHLKKALCTLLENHRWCCIII